jgi:hypothetical protein
MSRKGYVFSLGLTGALVAFFVFSLTVPSYAETDVTSQVQLLKSVLNYDRLTKASSLDVSVKNIGQQVLLSPIKVVVDSVSPSTVQVSNADGVTLDGKPYFQYTTSSGTLVPGESIGSKTWKLSNPSAVKFSYVTHVQAALPDAAGVIGTGGGTVQTYDGQYISIPNGALNKDTFFVVQNLIPAILPTPLPEGVDFFGGIEVFPNGTFLNRPATVRIKLNDVTIQKGTSIPLLTFDDVLGTYVFEGWEGIVDGDGFVVSDMVSHFSVIVAASTKFVYGTPLGAFNGIVNFSNRGGSKIYGFLGWKYECVEYVNRYYYEIFGYPSLKGTGDAYTYFENLPSRFSDLTAYNNEGSIPPIPNDILVWGASPANHYAGHVAIVRDVQEGSVNVIQQNVTQSDEDAFYALPMTSQNGIYKVTSSLGPVLGWVRTDREPNYVLISVDDQTVNNTVNNVAWWSVSYAGVASSQYYKCYKGNGYLNGFHYAPSRVTEDNIFATGYWMFLPQGQDYIKVDVFAFIPSTSTNSLPKSEKVTYNIGVFDTNGVPQGLIYSKTVDQSAINDSWTLLAQDVPIPQGSMLVAIMTNVTGESGKYAVFNAIKIVSYPW